MDNLVKFVGLQILSRKGLKLFIDVRVDLLSSYSNLVKFIS